jgi:hypothetical protein
MVPGQKSSMFVFLTFLHSRSTKNVYAWTDGVI